MANNQNLKGHGFDERTAEEQRAIARQGGVASGKSRRERADLRKQMQLWLETEVAKDKNGNPLTGAELMANVAAKEMKNGNPKFWELIRDTAGFKPVEKVMVSEVEQSVIDEVEKAVLDDDESAGD